MTRYRPWTSLLVLMACVPLQLVAGTDLYTRNLHCDQLSRARSQVICHALEQEMEWTWFGHTIVSPGWRPSFSGVARVFCTLPIAAADTPALIPLTGWGEGTADRDWRPQSGAEWLLFLVGAKTFEYPLPDRLLEHIDIAISTPSSIWNPANPAFPLRNGCPGRSN